MMSKNITLKITSDRNSYYFAVDAGAGFVDLGSAMTIGLATEVTEIMTFTVHLSACLRKTASPS